MMSRPAVTEFAPYYVRYIAMVPEDDILSVLKAQVVDISNAAAAVTSGREKFRYDTGKWSIREVFGHLIDGERVFGYRAFCISRGEQAPLPSFDENSYIRESTYDACPLNDLVAELVLLRNANTAFLSRLTDANWLRFGTASNKPVTVRALAFIMAGHMRHHLEILRTRYGVAPGS